MEPKQSSPEAIPGGGPRSPEQYVPDERSIEVPLPNPEHREQTPAERESTPPVAQTAQPVPIALPTPVAPVQDDQASKKQDDDSPQVAGDEDLIEKEWVDKAKKIIAETKDDPHSREQAVSRLQADYLRKRYGKELGSSS